MLQKGVGEYKYKSDDGKEGTGLRSTYQTSRKGMSKRRFGKVMRRLGRKHGQESVITKDKDKPARLHDTQNKKPNKSANLGNQSGKIQKVKVRHQEQKSEVENSQKQTKKRITTIKNAIDDLQKDHDENCCKQPTNISKKQ
ncbi:MAG: hypothetical protein CM15mV11_0870 [Caudoviricetes sp.]|nr:MAG: hypothetical protein CM15mV11_0870 [Caudoviricetes sp.]